MLRGATKRALVLAAVAWCGGLAGHANADGALPNSLGVLLPKDRSHSILVATNFGLLSSEDDGAHWSLVCEDAVGIGTALYQLGPAPQDRLFTVTLDGFARSTDFGCGWDEVVVLNKPTDVFPDPTDADRVYAIANRASKDGGQAPQAVFASKDGGKTFGAALFTAPANAYLTGIEAAASDKDTLYATLTLFEAETSDAYVARSTRGAPAAAQPIAVRLGRCRRSRP